MEKGVRSMQNVQGRIEGPFGEDSGVWRQAEIWRAFWEGDKQEKATVAAPQGNGHFGKMPAAATPKGKSTPAKKSVVKGKGEKKRVHNSKPAPIAGPAKPPSKREADDWVSVGLQSTTTDKKFAT